MLISDVFPSNYLKASDLNGKVFALTIDRIELVNLDGIQKPVLFFHNRDRGMVLNKTNALVLQNAFGDQTDNWRGRAVELFSTSVNFRGEQTTGLRLRVPAADTEEIEPDIPW